MVKAFLDISPVLSIIVAILSLIYTIRHESRSANREELTDLKEELSQIKKDLKKCEEEREESRNEWTRKEIELLKEIASNSKRINDLEDEIRWLKREREGS